MDKLIEQILKFISESNPAYLLLSGALILGFLLFGLLIFRLIEIAIRFSLKKLSKDKITALKSEDQQGF